MTPRANIAAVGAYRYGGGMAASSSRPRIKKALSASSASTWLQCPMKFRLIHVDGFKEPPNQATTRGTLVHAVLENLYDLPAQDRTPVAAESLIEPAYQELFAGREDFEALFADPALKNKWKEDVRALVNQYFAMENPRRLQPYAREQLINVEIADRIALRGFIDRVDKAPNGALRIVDYKTGKSPRPRYMEDKLFQMRFYALLLDKSGEGLPARTQLVFLGDGRTLTFDPTREEIDAFEHYLVGLWQQIEHAIRTRFFPPKKQILCKWCGVSQFCPLYGDEPTISETGLAELLEVKRSNVS